jgi:hypothetical protein
MTLRSPGAASQRRVDGLHLTIRIKGAMKCSFHIYLDPNLYEVIGEEAKSSR